jgi:hypothetical protein
LRIAIGAVVEKSPSPFSTRSLCHRSWPVAAFSDTMRLSPVSMNSQLPYMPMPRFPIAPLPRQ